MKKLLFILIVLCSFNGFGQASRVFYQMGNNKFKEGKYEEALKEYNLAIGLDSNYLEAIIKRGKCQILMGDEKGAFNQIDFYIKNNPSNSNWHYGKAKLFLFKGRLKESVLSLDEAIRLDSNNFDYYLDRGATYMFMGDSLGVLSNFNRVLLLNDKSIKAYQTIGALSYLREDYETAIKYTSLAVNINPSDSKSYFHRGVSYIKLGQKEKGCADLVEAVRLDYRYAYAEKVKYCGKGR